MESDTFAIDSFQMLKLPHVVWYVRSLFWVLENQKEVLKVLESSGISFNSICNTFKFPVLEVFYIIIPLQFD